MAPMKISGAMMLSIALLSDVDAASQVPVGWLPPKGCEGGWKEHECCCMQCNATGIVFNATIKDRCFEIGGQCKLPTTSSYFRSAIPREAPAEYTLRNESDEVEQAHLIGGAPDEVTIVFMTRSLTDPLVHIKEAGAGTARAALGITDVHSSIMQPGGWNGYADASGPYPGTSYQKCVGAYKNATCYYSSDYVHTVTVSGLKPDTAYEYLPSTSSRWRHFRTPPAVGQPIKFGIVADLGQTSDSLSTMRHMMSSLQQSDIDAVVFPGDLSYADGFMPAWDTYGRLSEFLFEAVPTAYGVGNHEAATGSENFANFIPRYGWATRARSRSPSPLWFSYEAGLAHVVMLCSYCAFGEHSAQHDWLLKDLAAVDRQRTPWIVAAWHTPWYTTSDNHKMSEGEEMRKALEDIVYHFQVDVVFTGHVHAYERTVPVFQNRSVCNGPVYITIGDGGNKEGPACPWIAGDYGWTALREFSFGHGVLNILNRTHAHWTWHRNQDDESVSADEEWLQPAQYRCGRSFELMV